MSDTEDSMNDTAEFIIGAEVTCSDGVCGELRRVIVDPIARAVTHIVVEPRHRTNLGHLVPVDLVQSTADGVRLRCTMAQFEVLEDAEETRFLRGANGQWGYAQEDMLSLPYYGLGGFGVAGIGAGGLGMGTIPQAVSYDKVPVGEVEIVRGQRVHATDGSIGRVQGLVVDPSDHHVTHVLLQEGHLWGHKEVAIPISAVTSVDDGVRLSLTKGQLKELPAVDIEPHR
jgi:sporulation protein YlmC with PRC-barrel domain